MFQTFRIRRWGVFCVLPLWGAAVAAHVPDSTLFSVRHAEVNRLYNVQAGSLNPVRLTRNTVYDAGEAVLDYQWQKGRFHAIDASPHQDAFRVMISGLRRLGRFDLEGHIRYRNMVQRERSWNSTLYLSSGNPFILGDSIASDVSLEEFDLGASATYRVNSRWVAGLGLNLLTGSSADQTDPRPKTDATRIRITPGAEYRLSPGVALGAAVNVELYSASTSHAIINTQQNHKYFLMKGLGDYMRQSSSDVGSYPREYKGETYAGALQLTLTPEGRSWQNFLELQATTGREDATDGGSYFTFKGGDYDFSGFSLVNRWLLQRPGIHHRATVRAGYTSGEGTWYDQKKMTDTEHGNLSYYVVLGQSRVYETKRWNVQGEYGAALMRGGLPHLELKAGVALNHTADSHFDAGTQEQSYTLATLYAEAVKFFTLKKWQLSACLGGAYVTPLGDKTFASASEDLTAAYVAPAFEYASAGYAAVRARVEALVPLPAKRIGLRLFGQTDCRFYADDPTVSDCLDGKSQTTVHAGVALTF